MVSQSTELPDLQQARDAIARAVHQRSTSLDLSRKELTELPAEIGQLTKLQTLHLRGNRLAALPEWLGRLTNLRRGSPAWLVSPQLVGPDVGRRTSMRPSRARHSHVGERRLAATHIAVGRRVDRARSHAYHPLHPACSSPGHRAWPRQAESVPRARPCPRPDSGSETM